MSPWGDILHFLCFFREVAGSHLVQLLFVAVCARMLPYGGIEPLLSAGSEPSVTHPAYAM